MKPVKIGIVGSGAIGSTLAKLIRKSFAKEAVISYVCDRHKEKARRLAASLGKPTICLNVEQLVKKSDLIIEAASTVVAEEVTKLAWKYAKNVLVLSVGGLLKMDLPAARTTKFRVWVPSGAICGIDGVLAAREAGIKTVKIVTRKPPEGLREAPYFLKRKFPILKGNQEVCLFKGNVFDAVQNFPQNVNVAAVLALAGIGPYRTQVEIWTSKTYSGNQHEVTAEGHAGKFTSIIHNIPSELNPKTSALAIYAALATLRKMFSPVRI